MHAKQIAVLLIFLLCTTPARACWQVGQKPIKLSNSKIQAVMTLNGNAIAHAPVMLTDKASKKIWRRETDGLGSVAFDNLKPGEYKLELISPSSEGFDVVLTPAFPVKTYVQIGFYADWCTRWTIRVS